MYPRLYRKQVQTRFCLALVAAAMALRLAGIPGFGAHLADSLVRLLNNDDFRRVLVYSQTGLELPEDQAPSPAVPVLVQTDTEPPLPSAAETPAEETETAPPSPTEQTPTQPPQPEPAFTAGEAEQIRIRGNCTYEADKAGLLLRPLPDLASEGPLVLIVHSHSCEAYTPTDSEAYESSGDHRTLDPDRSVIAVGDVLAQALEAQGIGVLHDRTLNDYPSYNDSYANARQKIQTWLEEYPSVGLVLDLHRDALDDPVRETAEAGGDVCAPLMLVVGTDEGGLSHPHWQDNLSLALKLQALGLRRGGGLMKPLDLRRERFNQDLCPGALIVEVGSTENTLSEAKKSAAVLAELIAELVP